MHPLRGPRHHRALQSLDSVSDDDVSFSSVESYRTSSSHPVANRQPGAPVIEVFGAVVNVHLVPDRLPDTGLPAIVSSKLAACVELGPHSTTTGRMHHKVDPECAVPGNHTGLLTSDRHKRRTFSPLSHRHTEAVKPRRSLSPNWLSDVAVTILPRESVSRYQGETAALSTVRSLPTIAKKPNGRSEILELSVSGLGNVSLAHSSGWSRTNKKIRHDPKPPKAPDTSIMMVQQQLECSFNEMNKTGCLMPGFLPKPKKGKQLTKESFLELHRDAVALLQSPARFNPDYTPKRGLATSKFSGSLSIEL